MAPFDRDSPPIRDSPPLLFWVSVFVKAAVSVRDDRRFHSLHVYRVYRPPVSPCDRIVCIVSASSASLVSHDFYFARPCVLTCSHDFYFARQCEMQCIVSQYTVHRLSASHLQLWGRLAEVRRGETSHWTLLGNSQSYSTQPGKFGWSLVSHVVSSLSSFTRVLTALKPSLPAVHILISTL